MRLAAAIPRVLAEAARHTGSDVGHLPEHLARACARELPRGRSPAATRREAHRLAVAGGGLGGIGGIAGIAPATLVILVCEAAVGMAELDAADAGGTTEDRAAELLVLWELADDIEEAHRLLRDEGLGIRHAPRHLSWLSGVRSSSGNGKAAATVRRGARVGARRFGGRAVPVVGALFGAWDAHSELDRYADRARQYARAA